MVSYLKDSIHLQKTVGRGSRSITYRGTIIDDIPVATNRKVAVKVLAGKNDNTQCDTGNHNNCGGTMKKGRQKRMNSITAKTITVTVELSACSCYLNKR